ncbi:MAG: SMR family transporter [Solirubrobacterales bacterium]
MNLRFAGLCLLTLLMNAGANIALKWAMRGEANLMGQNLFQVVLALITNAWVWIGVVSFGVAFLSYSLILSRTNLSVAYPIITSLGFVVITVVSVFLFQEKLSLLQGGGLALILGGVWMVSMY